MSCWQKRRSTRASARNSTRLSPSWPASKLLLKSLLLRIIKVFNTHDTSTMLHHLEPHSLPSWTLAASGSIINLVSIISSQLALNVINVKSKVNFFINSSRQFSLLLLYDSIGIDCQCLIWLKCNELKMTGVYEWAKENMPFCGFSWLQTKATYAPRVWNARSWLKVLKHLLMLATSHKFWTWIICLVDFRIFFVQGHRCISTSLIEKTFTLRRSAWCTLSFGRRVRRLKWKQSWALKLVVDVIDCWSLIVFGGENVTIHSYM